MPTRLAYKITEEFLAMIAGFFGTEVTPFAEGMYCLMEMISPTEVNLKIVTEEMVFEEYKKDDTLHIFK